METLFTSEGFAGCKLKFSKRTEEETRPHQIIFSACLWKWPWGFPNPSLMGIWSSFPGCKVGVSWSWPHMSTKMRQRLNCVQLHFQSAFDIAWCWIKQRTNLHNTVHCDRASLCSGNPLHLCTIVSSSNLQRHLPFSLRFPGFRQYRQTNSGCGLSPYKFIIPSHRIFYVISLRNDSIVKFCAKVF